MSKVTSLFHTDSLKTFMKMERNVLLRGEAGVGKTAKIIDICNFLNLKIGYFSAATMDPWVDFIGIPSKSEDEHEGEKYMAILRPEVFVKGHYDILFFDELNRAPSKVRNGVMEIIQFGSVNGKKIKGLKQVWAAINPESDENSDTDYDVEPLDPAIKDRFHVHIDVPYDVDEEYLQRTFPKFGLKAAEFWRANANEEIQKQRKDKFSPRRLTNALQFITDIIEDGCPEDRIIFLLRGIVPSWVGAKPLFDALTKNKLQIQLESIDLKDHASIKKLLTLNNCQELEKFGYWDDYNKVATYLPFMQEEYVHKKLELWSDVESEADGILNLRKSLEKTGYSKMFESEVFKSVYKNSVAKISENVNLRNFYDNVCTDICVHYPNEEYGEFEDMDTTGKSMTDFIVACFQYDKFIANKFIDMEKSLSATDRTLTVFPLACLVAAIEQKITGTDIFKNHICGSGFFDNIELDNKDYTPLEHYQRIESIILSENFEMADVNKIFHWSLSAIEYDNEIFKVADSFAVIASMGLDPQHFSKYDEFESRSKEVKNDKNAKMLCTEIKDYFFEKTIPNFYLKTKEDDEKKIMMEFIEKRISKIFNIDRFSKDGKLSEVKQKAEEYIQKLNGY